jgi:DNA-binding phage protein
LGQIKQIEKMKTSKFDIADYLDIKEMIAEYLNTVLEEGIMQM